MKRIVLLVLVLNFLIFTGGVFATEKVNINSSNLQELDKITHVGEKTAQKIIDGRPYSSVQDLSRVKGIGDGKYLQDIINEGIACVNCKTTSAEISAEISAEKTDTENTKTETKTYPTGILINEVLASAEGSDETGEWFEIFNSNNFEVDLSGWKIKDTIGTSKTFTIPNGTKILANGFLVFMRPETKITLNNDGDGLILQNPAEEIADSVEIPKAVKNVSFAKFFSDWKETNNLTLGSKNIESQKISSKDLPKKEKPVNNIVEEDLTASLNQNITKINKPWFLFLIAVTITIISALAVLFIKIKFNKTNVRT
jgi:hypothetical protein